MSRENKIYAIAGHHHRDPGATATHESTGSIKEADLTIEGRYLIKSYLQHPNIVTDNDNHTLSQVLAEINKDIFVNDILIDLHFNSFSNPIASGVEVIIPNNPSQKTLSMGKEICKNLSDIMGIPNRGLKTISQTHRSRIGILEGRGHRLLLEYCFLSNQNDIESYIKMKHIVNYSVAETLDKYVKMV